MTPWIIIILITFLMTFKSDRVELKYFLYCLLLLFSIVRGEDVGTDTINYINMADRNTFYTSGDMSISDVRSFEILTYSIVLFLQTTGLSGRWLLVFFAVINLMFLHLAFKKFKVNEILALFFFLVLGHYMASFNAARQYASCAVVLYAFSVLLIDGNIRKFIFLILFSSAIHFSSIIWLLALGIKFIYPYFTSKKLLFILMICTFPFTFIPIGIERILLYLPEELSYVKHYGELSSEYVQFSTMGILSALISLLIAGYLFLDGNKQKPTIIEFFFAFSYIITLLFYTVPNNISRVFLPLQLFYIIYYAVYFTENKPLKKNKTFIAYMMISILNIYITVTSILANSNGVYPYESILFSLVSK